MDVTTFFELSEFISLSLLLIFSSGIVFLLPIFMLGLTSLKIVDKKFWIRNWRYALIAILIFCAIITPDGTGVTMLILALPLIALYLIGCYLAKR
jgi:sec-independent protein translocase protein TatC